MTHTQLITQLRLLVGNPTVANVPDATLTTYLNMAYVQIATRWRFHKNRVRSTINTTINTHTYSLPAGTLILHNVWNRTYNTRLRKVSALDSVNVDIQSSQNHIACPIYYYRQDDSIILYPTPDAVYALEVYVTKTPTALAAGGDVPIIPETWHDLIPLWARWLYWDAHGDLGKGQQAFNAIGLWLRTKPNEFDEEDQAYMQGIEVPSSSPERLPFDRAN